VSEAPAECNYSTPFAVTGDSLAVKGNPNVSFQVGKVTFKHTFLLNQSPTTAAGILGVNFLTPRQAVLDLGGSTVKLCRRVNYDSVETVHVTSNRADCGRRGKRGLISHVFVSSILPHSSSEEK
jgi:hypothetical protein